eukprot:4195123-Pyramimonas_sp.AAC.1
MTGTWPRADWRAGAIQSGGDGRGPSALGNAAPQPDPPRGPPSKGVDGLSLQVAKGDSGAHKE